MYFRLSNPDQNYYDLKNPIPESVQKKIPQNVQLVYWDYYHQDAAMDGDLQHDVGDLPGLLSELEECDFVIGSRYAAGGGFREKWNPFRVLVSRTAALMARIMLGVKVKDPMSGFFALRRTAFDRVAPRLSPKGFKIMLELLYLLTRSPKPCLVVEHGITFGLREHGESKLSAKVMLDYLRMLRALRRSKQA